MKKAILIKSLMIGALVSLGVLGLGVSMVNADSVYDEMADSTITLTPGTTYDLETMLNYALQSEYLAKAEYEAILAAYGDIRPFNNILRADESHIDLLLPLFESYGFIIPEDASAESVVLPDSMTSAIATGIEAEKATIAMYEAFLAQTDVPEDARVVFQYLLEASQRHLVSLQKDRASCYGRDVAAGFRNMFRFGTEKGHGTGNRGFGQNQGQAYSNR